MRVVKSRSIAGQVVRLIMALALGMSFLLSFGLMGWTKAVAELDRALLKPAEQSLSAHTFLSLATPVAHAARPADGLPPGMVLGYFYDPGNAPGPLAMLNHYLAVLTGIIPFWYQINRNGTVVGSTDPAVLRLAQQHHLWTFALVQNMTGQPVFGPLLNSPEARSRAVNNMLTLVESNGYNGVNLDWEGIAPQERQQFSTFVQMLANTFHRHGYYVTLSLPAETRNQPSDSWTGAYNFKSLGKAADLVMIMAYNQHYAGGAPGPIASPAWVKKVLDYTISVIPPSKVILGIPGYGYDWSANGPAAALTYYQAESLANQYGVSPAANHFIYVQGGQLHSVWFENTSSLLSKINLVSGYEIRGVALWRLGIEDPKIWNFLQ